MNRTKTKAVSDKTPYKATFRKKPNLSDVWEWGEKLWVRVKKGNKLGGRVKEGKWMGVSDESKGMHMYWPDKKTLSTKQNIYFDKTKSSVSRLEGEEWDFIETKSDYTPVLPAEIPQNTPETIHDTPDIISDEDETLSEPEIPNKRIRKPTAKIREIIEGRAVASNLPSAPKFTIGTQLPSIPDVPGDVLEMDESVDWMMLLEESLMAQTSEMEALEPPSLAVARKSPDWPAWEKAICEELDVFDSRKDMGDG